ncbi:CAMK family protein kinase [Tritrichomonas foetus]|uniref:CAMK family protein kinase n=1 Tax=Tritrichomonas foetus TaxID=1144522 RepID=A0A1J4JDY5_9EUKA|nr:CAMK family protein kinase [Tritrichomonas foetus]|eukprot:OHS95883.1 CAMK family protein kinase [Tritrichomonas foetus]
MLGDYIIEKMIGTGAYSQIFRARHSKTQAKVAIKIITKDDYHQNQNIRDHFDAEAAILTRIKHPYIIEVFEVVENNKCMGLVMEFLEKGDLLDLVNGKSKITENDAQRIYAQIISILTYLHDELKMVHCDIKLDNILLDRNNNIRLIDFGFTAEVKNSAPQLEGLRGSPAYVAPEIVKKRKYNSAVDIWSSGVTLYGLITETLPFVGNTISEQLKQIVDNDPTYPSNLSPVLIDLFTLLLKKDPMERISLTDLRKHPWVAKAYQNLKPTIANFYKYMSRPDKEIFAIMQECKISTSGLLSSVMNGSETPTMNVYKILRRAKALDLIAGKEIHIAFNDTSQIVNNIMMKEQRKGKSRLSSNRENSSEASNLQSNNLLKHGKVGTQLNLGFKPNVLKKKNNS